MQLGVEANINTLCEIKFKCQYNYEIDNVGNGKVQKLTI